MVAAIARRSAAAAASLNRYPDRECLALRADLARYLNTDAPVRLTAEQLWPANGSNEIMQQLLQAFGGPGRTALSFAPTYSMYPEYARNTHTGWVTGRRAADFGIDLAAGGRADRPRCSRQLMMLASPNNPTGTALPQSPSCAGCWSWRPAWWWWTRPTPSSAGRACPARWSCWPSTRSWS